MTTLIRHGGAIAAVATKRRVILTRPLDEPDRRFVLALGRYAADVDDGLLPGPYDTADAELYARTVLIDDAEFLERAGELDEELAEHFLVPLTQIAAKRAEFDMPEDR